MDDRNHNSIEPWGDWEYGTGRTRPPKSHSGMIAALRLMTDGMAPNEAIAVSITNKCFDEYEYALVRDVVMTRFAQ